MMTPLPLRGKLAVAGPTGGGCFPGATVTAAAGLAAPGGGHSRGRSMPSPAAAPLWSLAPIAAPTPGAMAGAAATAASAVTAAAVKATASSCLTKQQHHQQGRMVAASAWRAGAPAGGGGGGQYDGGWDGRRAVGAAAAALDGGGGVGPDGGGGDAAGFLELPTAEVRMSMVSERAASTCALGPEVAERMQADCIRAVRSWCKLGYGDYVVVHVEHQQLATPAGTPPGLLTSAAVTFAAPDGRRHAAVAVSVGVLCGTAASSPPPKTPSLPPSPSRASVNNQFGGAGGGSRRRTMAAAHVAPGSSAPSLDPLPGLSLHWGCSYGPGQRWHTAAAGWHTLPAVSYDAGKGAWQTPLAVRQAIPLDLDSDSDLEGVGGSGPGGPMVAVYSLVMQLPWEGPIRSGGVCFVLKTARNQWLKARVLPAAAGGGGGGNPASGGGAAASSGGSGGGGEADYWIPTASLPLVANGVALLPDVFRMSHSDSLPQVVATTAGSMVPYDRGSDQTYHINVRAPSSKSDRPWVTRQLVVTRESLPSFIHALGYTTIVPTSELPDGASEEAFEAIPLKSPGLVELVDGGTYIAVVSSLEQQVKALQGWQDSNVEADEAVGTKHAITWLQEAGHSEVEELCAKFLRVGNKKVEVDGVVLADNCAAIVEAKTKLTSGAAVSFADKMALIRMMVDEVEASSSTPLVQLKGKRLLPVLCGRTVTKNTTDLQKMAAICRQHQIECWDVSGSGVETSSGCFESPYVHPRSSTGRGDSTSVAAGKTSTGPRMGITGSVLHLPSSALRPRYRAAFIQQRVYGVRLA